MKKRMASQLVYSGKNALKSATPAVRKARDCSKLTLEQLQLLASVPGNSDVVEELNRRQAR
jgi:hypothetical protein